MRTKSELNDVLVGSTGFVGSNLMMSHDFARAVHSPNVDSAFGSSPDLLVYAGVPSTMYLANLDPEADLSLMRVARDNIRRIGAKKTVLISTITVYGDSRGKNEKDEPDSSPQSAYGENRYLLERWVREDFPSATIVRLPALYGRNLKKNFIFDMINVVPQMLSSERWKELSVLSDLVRESYSEAENGFWHLRPEADNRSLKEWFGRNSFNALSFTDSRSRFQFYSLSQLWSDISKSLGNQWDVLNIATPPVSAAEVYEYVCGQSWRNELSGKPFDYDMRSIHARGGQAEPGYLCAKEEELASLKRFVVGNSK